MSKWTHPVCGPCYDDLEPGREPSRLVTPDLETCCRCGQLTRSGIYYRADPATMLCQGTHREDQ